METRPKNLSNKTKILISDHVNLNIWSLNTTSVRWCHGSCVVHYVECHRWNGHQLRTFSWWPWNGIFFGMPTSMLNIQKCIALITFNFMHRFFCLMIFQCFNDKEELLRNMMGLVGNVAEVKHLRNRLMKSEFITVFSNLLDSDSDGIEVIISFLRTNTSCYNRLKSIFISKVSYNAAGVLAHIASDGPADWTIGKLCFVSLTWPNFQKVRTESELVLKMYLEMKRRRNWANYVYFKIMLTFS